MSLSIFFYLSGLLILFVGNRMIGSPQEIPLPTLLLAIVAFAASLFVSFRKIERENLNRRKLDISILAFIAIGIFSLCIYALSLPPAGKTLGIDPAGKIRLTLSVLWPILLLSASLPILLLDWARSQMPVVVQPRRALHATLMGISIALALSATFPINYLASRHYQTFDFRQIRTTVPGEATRALVNSLSSQVDVHLFFPPANDVQRELRPYFDELAKGSTHFNLFVVDQAIELELARRFQITSNGSVVISIGEDSERINIGTSIESAKNQLRRFDSLFQSRLISLTRREKTIYFTVGHEEMHWSPSVQESAQRRLSGAKRILEQLNYKVDELGFGEGLGRAVPDDAAAIVIAGPKTPFMPEEISSIQRFLERGGSALLLLEPGGEDHTELTALFSVRYHNSLIHNDRHHLLRSRTKADRAFIGTNRFTAHPSVSTLARHSAQLALIIDGSGRLEANPAPDLSVTATIRSMPQSWVDIIPNHEFDAGTEQRETWDLGVAIEGKDFRGAVLAGATAISDPLLGNQGNSQWFVDTIKWLVEEEQTTGLIETEEDVRIQHTREQDIAWFFGTIFAVPLLVLVAGLFYTRRRFVRGIR